jgi:hypothetical protein
MRARLADRAALLGCPISGVLEIPVDAAGCLPPEFTTGRTGKARLKFPCALPVAEKFGLTGNGRIFVPDRCPRVKLTVRYLSAVSRLR